jgi:hypothetical protein
MDNQKNDDFMKKMMKPNSKENAINGFHSASIQHHFIDDTWDYIQKFINNISVEEN